MWCSDVFNELLPLCSGCQSPFDLRCRSPQVLPCSHTLCLACVTQDSKMRKSNKRRCFTCDKRYTSFQLNTALAEAIERIRVRREALDSQSRRCDECEKRAYVSWMRRCVTCEITLKEANLTSVICMECCVDRHNGHALRVVTTEAYVQKDDKTSGFSAANSPRLHPNSRLQSTSSASSGFSSGGMVSSSPNVDGRNGIGHKMTSFISRISRSGSVPPPPSSSTPYPPSTCSSSSSSSFHHSPHIVISSTSNSSSSSNSHHQPPPPSVIPPLVPSPKSVRRIPNRPQMGKLSPSYMTPSRSMGKKELSALIDKADIMRVENSPFYEGQSLYGVSLLVGAGGGGSGGHLHSISSASSVSETNNRLSNEVFAPPTSSLTRPLEMKRASLPTTEGDYHRLSPYPDRKSPILLPYSKVSFSGTNSKASSPLANMPRRDPRIRGGPSYLHDQNAGSGAHYENHRSSIHSSGSSSGHGGDGLCLPTPLSPSTSSASSTTSSRPVPPPPPPSQSQTAVAPSATGVAQSDQKEAERRRKEMFFDKHALNDKKRDDYQHLMRDVAPSQYINVTRSCECLPSQIGKLDANNNDDNNNNNNAEGKRSEGRRRPIFANLSDHCCSYEYIGS